MSGEELIGLLPMAGRARRLGALPCSKEVLPLPCGGELGPDGRRAGARPLCLGLLESLRAAGVARAYAVLRRGKWDVPHYLGGGLAQGVDLAYLLVDDTAGVPFTLDRAYPYVRDARVALGFPDIVFEPQDALRRVRERQEGTGADLVLGLFPSDRPDKADMVRLDAAGSVVGLTIKDPRCGLRYTWSLAVWTPRFTRLLRWQVAEWTASDPPGRERHLGEVVAAALEQGLDVQAQPFPDGWYLDAGTPDDLLRAARHALGETGGCGRRAR